MGKSGYKQHNWTPADKEYLVKNFQKHTCVELAVHLGVTTAACKTMARQLKLCKTKKALQKVYQRPNKGQFKAGALPFNTLTDAAITTRTTNGVKSMWIRIALGKWQQYHHYIWLSAGNSIPEGYVLAFKNGDPLNCNIGNLELISRGVNLSRNRIGSTKREGLLEEMNAQRELKLQQRIEKADQRKARKILIMETQRQARAFAKEQTKLKARELRKQENKRRRVQHMQLINTDRLKKLEAKKLAAEQLKQSEMEKRELARALRVGAAPEKKLKLITAVPVKNVKAPKVKAVDKIILEERLRAREMKQQAKDKLKAIKAKKQREVKFEEEQKTKFKTRVINTSELIPLRVDSKTVVYIKPGQDPEKILEKYKKREMPDKYAGLPPTYQF